MATRNFTFTDLDKKILHSLPTDKWFGIVEVPVHFRCPWHRLMRLVRLGKLKYQPYNFIPKHPLPPMTASDRFKRIASNNIKGKRNDHNMYPMR